MRGTSLAAYTSARSQLGHWPGQAPNLASRRPSPPVEIPESEVHRVVGRFWHDVGEGHPAGSRTECPANVPEAKADLLHAVCDRIVVAGRSIVAARLTPAAYANGLALALPQVVMARPEGSEHALPTFVIEGVAALVEALRAA